MLDKILFYATIICVPINLVNAYYISNTSWKVAYIVLALYCSFMAYKLNKRVKEITYD